MRHTTNAVATIGLASTLLGCGQRLGDGAEDYAQDSAAAPEAEASAAASAPEASDASAPAATLPQLPDLPKLGDAAFTISIQGNDERVFVTNAPAIAAYRADSDRRVRALLKAAKSEGDELELAGEADPRRSSNHLIHDLFDQLSKGVDLERQWAALLDRPPLLVASLALDVATPMSAVIDILYTCGRAELSSFVAEVATPAGVRHIPFAPPVDSCATPAGQTECVSPTVFVGSDGVFVGLLAGPSPLVCAAGSRQKTPKVLLRAADGRCPIAPSEDAVAGVLELLDDLRGRTELCENVYFGAEPGVRWGHLIPHFASVLPRASIKIVAEPLVRPDCDQALSGEALERWLSSGGGDAAPPDVTFDPWAELAKGADKPPAADTTKPPAEAKAKIKAKLTTSIQVTGKGKGGVRRINKAHGAELDHCHRQLDDAARARIGAVTITYRINENGKTDAVEIEADSLGDAEFAACVAKSVSRWKYPSYKPAKVRFTVKSSPLR